MNAKIQQNFDKNNAFKLIKLKQNNLIFFSESTWFSSMQKRREMAEYKKNPVLLHSERYVMVQILMFNLPDSWNCRRTWKRQR